MVWQLVKYATAESVKGGMAVVRVRRVAVARRAESILMGGDDESVRMGLTCKFWTGV